MQHNFKQQTHSNTNSLTFVDDRDVKPLPSLAASGQRMLLIMQEQLTMLLRRTNPVKMRRVIFTEPSVQED